MKFVCLCSLLCLAIFPNLAEAQLGRLARRKATQFGFFISPESLGSSAYETVILRDARIATFTTYWKLQVHSQSRFEYDWTLPDRVVAFAVEHGLELHGTPLVWAYDKYIPDWVHQTPQEEAADVLREHIETVVGRYRDIASVWHVVNESFTYKGEYKDAYWYRQLGSDYMEIAFQTAHETDPNAKLIYNDYGLLEVDDRKYIAVRDRLVAMRDSGVPIHGIGWQLHLTLENAMAEDFPLLARMLEMSALGFTNYITELDITLPARTRDNLNLQGEAYRRVTEAFLQVPRRDSMQTWDVTDRHSWRGSRSAPLLYNTRYRQKAAYRGVRDALKETDAVRRFK